MDAQINYVGDEGLNEEAVSLIDSVLGDDEAPVAAAGFDFETKVFVITDRRLLIADAFEGLVLDLAHKDINSTMVDGRTLSFRDRGGKLHQHRFGKDQTVRELAAIAYRQKRQAGNAVSTNRRTEQDVGQGAHMATSETADENVPIADRVRFWEEQDRINQELIPRVIRQHELLTAHVADHENLPLVAGNAISEALAEAREEQRQSYEAALKSARQDLRQQYDDALDAARHEQQQQHDASLDAARAAIEDQARANLERAVSTLNDESRKVRNMLVGLAAAAVAIAVVAVIVGLLV